MTPAEFNRHIREAGFERVKHPLPYTTFRRVQNGHQQYVIRNTVMGDSFRLLLAVDRLPALDDPDVPPASVEAESPWFEYVTDRYRASDPAAWEGLMDKAAALEACWRWLESVGFDWLNDPNAKSAEEWRRQHDILVSRH